MSCTVVVHSSQTIQRVSLDLTERIPSNVSLPQITETHAHVSSRLGILLIVTSGMAVIPSAHSQQMRVPCPGLESLSSRLTNPQVQTEAKSCKQCCSGACARAEP